MMNIQALKTVLPPIENYVSGKAQKTKGELSAPCPWCQGDDRFIIWQTEDNGNGRYLCRQCGAAGDRVDFHCRREAVTVKELARRYLPGKPSQGKAMEAKKQPVPNTNTRHPAGQEKLTPEEISKLWAEIQAESARIKNPANNTLVLQYFLHRKRGISLDVIRSAVDAGTVALKWYDLPFELFNEHQSEILPTVSFLYKNAACEPCAVQHTDETKKGLNFARACKVFEPGSDAAGAFFVAGKSLDAAETVIIVESPINALSAASVFPDAACIALSSAAGGKVRHLQEKLKKKKVICFFDNDPAGRQAAFDAVAALKRKDIQAVEWSQEHPAGYDINDLLKDNRTEEIKQMIENAQVIPLEEAQQKKSKQPLTGPNRFFTESGRYRPSILVDELLKNYDLFFDGHSFFKYGDHGYWKRINDEAIGKAIKEMLADRAESRFIYDAIGLLKYEIFTPQEEREKNSLLLNLKNGMLDLKTKQLLPHDKKYFSTIQLPVSYDPATDCPRFKKFLSQIFADAPDKSKTVQEYVGYCLYPENIFEKALFCIGHGSNGKTTFINAVESLFGIQNISHLELHQLGERFALINIKDSLLNTCADLSTNKKADFNMFKQVTSRDTISSDVKFGKRFITFKPRCKCLFAMNSTPAINDRSYGLSRRLIIINFNQRFDKGSRDVNLDHKLKQERSGILNWALTGLDELLKNKAFYECEQVKAEKDNFLTEVDNVKMFIQDLCQVGYLNTIRKTTLLEAYNRFCESCRLYPLKRPEFYQQLYVLIPDLNEYKEKSGPWFFQGIELIKEDA